MREFALNLPWLAQLALAFALIITVGLAAVAADEFLHGPRWARIVITVKERVQR